MNLKSKTDDRQTGLIILDAVMIGLLLINLNLIVFDWLFQSELIRSQLERFLPAFSEWYAVHIHRDFLRIDLIFVAIFLTEFIFHWIRDIYHQEHARWYYFPFIYWYDLLGCVPIGSLRFLRLLRFVSIIHRLHRRGIIDVTRFPMFDVFTRFINIIIEEITDRVVIRILRNVRNEVKEGTPVINQIVHDVVKPRQKNVVNWLSMRIRHVARENALRYDEDIRHYVDRRIGEAVQESDDIKNLRMFPFVGKQVEQMIERATADIVFNVINGAIRDLGSEDNRVFFEDLTDIILQEIDSKDEQSPNINRIITDLIVQSLDVIIAKVSIKEWRYKDIAEQEELLKEKLRENLQEQV